MTIEPERQNNSRMSNTDRTIKIFTDPQSAFEDIKNYPNWIFPVVLAIIVTVNAAYLTYDIQADFQKQIILNSERIPDSFKDRQLEALEETSGFQRYALPAAVAIGIEILIFVFTAVGVRFWGNFIFGGEQSFKMVFSMVSWAGLIGVIETIIRTSIMLAKNSIHAYTSLALLMDPADFSTLAFNLLNVFDIFTIWKVIVYSIGFSIFYNMSRNRALIGIITLFVVYTVFKLGWILLSFSFV